VATRLPKDWHEAIFRGNAMELYGWSHEDLADTA
jgi:hypothetical protein